MQLRFKTYYLYCLTLLAFWACSSAPSQQSATSFSSNDLSGKSFSVAVDGPNNDLMKDVEVTMIFNKDTTGTFRLKKGSVMKQMNFGWRLVSDSLRLQYPGEVEEYRGETKLHTPEPAMYAVSKETNGYLLKGRKDQMLLALVK